MKVVIGPPPNFAEIEKVFPLKGRSPIFAWGDTIYNPLGGEITPELLVHEQVHGWRQGTATEDVERWWKNYILFQDFRLAEEIPAHKAELQAYWRNYPDRNARALAWHKIALRLASPLYGSMVSYPEARNLIRI